MMTCNDDLVQLYVEGDLEPMEAAIVEAHLKGCADCRRQAGFYKGLFWDLAHGERLAPAPDPADAEGLAALLKSEWDRTERRMDRAPTWGALWLTANPVMTASARVVGDAGRVVGDAGRAGIRRLLGRKGGGGR